VIENFDMQMRVLTILFCSSELGFCECRQLLKRCLGQLSLRGLCDVLPRIPHVVAQLTGDQHSLPSTEMHASLHIECQLLLSDCS
jgi:hypothetical protein